MKEAFISFEIAKLLKEKGFDEVCWRYWSIPEQEMYGTDGIPFQNNSLNEDYCTAPTHQMTCAWLREKKNIHIDFYYLPIHKKYMWSVVETKDPKGTGSEELYEDAVEAALKYCLENLIK